MQTRHLSFPFLILLLIVNQLVSAPPVRAQAPPFLREGEAPAEPHPANISHLQAAASTGTSQWDYGRRAGSACRPSQVAPDLNFWAMSTPSPGKNRGARQHQTRIGAGEKWKPAHLAHNSALLAPIALQLSS